MSCFIWRCIYVIKSLANQAEGWYSFHRQWGDSCLIVWCGNLTILLSGLTFHCFWYRKQKTLCDSLHRPSRSDFVQLEFEGVHMMKRNKITALLYFITSLLFYVSAILNFTSDVGMGVIYLCLGSTSLCLGATWLNKNKKDDDNK